MKNLLLVLFPLLLALSGSTVHYKSNTTADSLPAGTRIDFQISMPGDATATKFSYVVPASTTKPPVVSPPVSGLTVLKSIPNQSASVGSAFSFVIPDNTFQGATNYDVSDLPKGLRWNSGSKSITGTPMVADSRTITVTGSNGATIVQTKFVLSVGSNAAPLPDVPLVIHPPTDPTLSTGSGTAVRQAVAFNFSSQPNRVNRMQSPTVSPYLDGWKMKQSEIIVGGNGGMNETPDQLRARGHNWLNACWFYCSDDRPFGYPKSTDNLFFEYNGNNFAPYHTNAYLAVVEEFQNVANEVTGRLPTWNTVRENGLIDGVATVKEASFNIEYYWFLQSDWDKLSDSERDRTYYNFASNVRERLRDTYNRGGIDAIQQAQHQKWRNVIGLTVQYLNRNCNGMKAFYGDFWGLSKFHNLRNWNERISPTELLTANVNDNTLFPDANETVNAGQITLPNGQTFDVSGNLNAMQGRRNVYHYEWDVSMKQKDYQDFFSVGRDAPDSRKNINDWYAKIRPDLDRPYNIVYHALLNKAIARQKGWLDFRFYWQVQSIYEHSILISDAGWQEAAGAWVPWTLNNPDPVLRNTKIPLHPEIAYNMVVLARFMYDGLFKWGSGCCSKINPDASVGENVSPTVHLVSREAEQLALTELGQYNETVFTADQRRHISDIPVLAPNGQYVTGDPSVMLKANAPLVIGIDSPSTGKELYAIYYPNADRFGETLVRWKSPIDGAELSGVAKGWQMTLYVRK